MPNNFTPQQIEQFLQEFFDVVGARQYIGARYVPIFGRAGEDTVEWDDGAPYEPLTVVMHQGVSYVSRRYVPTGIQITDTDYWVETYRFNAQVEQYRQEVLSFQGQIDQVRDDMESDYVPFPDSVTYPKYGTLGQVLTTLSNGTTKWEDPVTVDAAIAEPLIESWLDEHPEATTTVQDGSVTAKKVNNSVFRAPIPNTIGASNYQTLLDVNSADDIPVAIGNSYLFFLSDITSAMIANLPEYGPFTMLITMEFEYSGNHAAGATQIASCMGTSGTPRLYWRCSRGSSSQTWWSDWERVFPLDSSGIPDTYFHSQFNNTVSSDTYATFGVTDVDTIPSQFGSNLLFFTNTITEQQVSHLPEAAYGKFTTLLTYKLGNSYGNSGATQIAFVITPSKTYGVYVRNSYGSASNYSWHDWIEIQNSESLSSYALTSPIQESTTIGMANYQQYGITDLDTIAESYNSSILFMNADITPDAIANLPRYGAFNRVVTFKYNNYYKNSGVIQLCASGGGSPTFFMRTSYGTSDTAYWSKWIQLTTEVDETSLHTVDILRKVVCCGDSYTSGHIQISGSTTQTNEDYAWPHYMETITGNEYVNCGHSGTTVLTWPTATRGLPKAQAAGLAQAYIIGLMINDVNFGETLGTSADIGTQAETYYGGLSRIVESLHAISNDAHIFIQTCPREGTSWDDFNQAVIDVVEYYANTMNTHLLELRNYKDLYGIPSITEDYIGGHYTAIGYQQFAQILSRAISEYINANITKFQDVHLIPIS